MNFISQLSLRLLFWSILFGLIAGIFGISVSIINIADFYLQEGTQQKSNSFSYKVLPTDTLRLTSTTISSIQNIEGVAFVDPYFNPTNKFTASINYFGFTASYPVQIKSVPERIGRTIAQPNYIQYWSSADLNQIPVLLPQQAISLYNNLAPQRGWPELPESAFLGLPGVKLTIDFSPTTPLITEPTNNNEPLTNLIQNNTPPILTNYDLNVIISGFDKEEFGTIVGVDSEKLFSVFEYLNLNPSYDCFIIETVPGLTTAQARKTSRDIQDLGFNIDSAYQEDFQQGLFLRIKYTIAIFGGSILFAFIMLLFYSARGILARIKQRIILYKLWAIPEHSISFTVICSLLFSIITGLVSWVITFFAVIPAQKYIIDSLSQLGINTPPLDTSVIVSLQTAAISGSLYFLIILFTVIVFSFSIPKTHYIKKY